MESVEKTVKRNSTDRDDQWSFLHLHLPNGYYQVVIEGIRPYSESSGVAVDDIFLAPCDTLRKIIIQVYCP